MMNNPQRLLVKRYVGNTNNEGTIYLSAINFCDNHIENLYLPFCEEYQLYVGSSCGGFLYFDDLNGHVIVWNPTTKEMKTLPLSDVERPSGIDLTICHGGGFGFDSNSGDYKFIRYMRHYYEEGEPEVGRTEYRGFTTQVELYSYNSDSWREISHDPSVTSISYPGSAYVDGCLYWLGLRHVPAFVYCVEAFDFANEAFSSFALPTTMVSEEWVPNFVDLDGSLGAIICPNKGISKPVELWVFSTQTLWTKVFDVVLSGVERPLGLGENGRLLFFEGIIDNSDGQQIQLLVYDRTTQELKKLDIYDYPRGGLNVLSYVETTAPLPKAKK
ncbi:hypothetical protein C2S51_021599 [Perilla frutescens var. frutescens]|nr:hypothetical protein C2S51_021599 [Perilla frutescens var. frutescens]